MDREGFASLMSTLADAWNAGDSRGIGTYHGITLVRPENDKIADWREYQYPSELDWEAFPAGNRS